MDRLDIVVNRIGSIPEDSFLWTLVGGCVAGLLFGAIGAWGLVRHNADPSFFIATAAKLSLLLFVAGFGAPTIFFEIKLKQALIWGISGATGLFIGICTPILLVLIL